MFLGLGWTPSEGQFPAPSAESRHARGVPFIVSHGADLVRAFPRSTALAGWQQWGANLLEEHARACKAEPQCISDMLARYSRSETLGAVFKQLGPAAYLLSLAAIADYEIDYARSGLPLTLQQLETALSLHEALHPRAPRIAAAGLTTYQPFAPSETFPQQLKDSLFLAKAAVDANRKAGFDDLAKEAERRLLYRRGYLPASDHQKKVRPHRRLTYLLDFALKHSPHCRMSQNKRHERIADIVREWMDPKEQGLIAQAGTAAEKVAAIRAKSAQRVRQSLEYMAATHAPAPPPCADSGAGVLTPIYFLTLTRSVLELLGTVQPVTSAHELCGRRFAGASVILHYRELRE